MTTRRILILSPPSSSPQTLSLLKDLTGTSPQPDLNGSTAGLTHSLTLSTPYYNADVPIWIDEITDPADWKNEFLKAEAAEVVEAVGAWVYVSSGILDKDTLKAIQEVIEEHTPGADVVCLAVSRDAPRDQRGAQEEKEDLCLEYGFEYVDYHATGKNEFGEKQGLERIREALEANEWSAGDEEEDGMGLLDELDFEGDEDDGFEREEAEMTAELFGMKAALNAEEDGEAEDVESLGAHGQEKDGVEDLDRMLSKLMAIKEQSAGLPEEQRKRLAAKAVRDIMKDNPAV